MNTFLGKDGSPTVLPREVIRSTEEEKQLQIQNLENFQKSHADKSEQILHDLQISAINQENLFEKMANDDKQNENFYRDFSYLFEAPLLRASQKIHKSQLQMAKFLGLNRITLRKKIEQYKELI